jgi:hypothetical protein
MLDTPAKKARHLKEHRDWDQEFHGYLKQRELIIWNGKLMSIEEADRSYYEEETIRRYNEILEKGKLILLSGCNRILGCNCGKRSCSFNTGTGRKSGWNSGQW